MGKRLDQRRELSGKALPGARAERVGQRCLELAGPCARLDQRASGRLLEPAQQPELLGPRVGRKPTGVLEQLFEEFGEARALLIGVGTIHDDVTRGGEGHRAEAGGEVLSVDRATHLRRIEQLHGHE